MSNGDQREDKGAQNSTTKVSSAQLLYIWVSKTVRFLYLPDIRLHSYITLQRYIT